MISYLVLPAKGHFSLGRATETAGTVIDVLVPPKVGLRTVLTKVEYTCGSTAHTLTCMRPLATTTLAAAAAAAQTDITLAADPGDYTGVKTADNGIAAGDYLVIETPDGTFHMDTVASVASLVITMDNNVPTGGLASGAKVWFFGVTTDTDPNTGLPHPQYLCIASTVNSIPPVGNGVAYGSLGTYEPLIVHSNNATAAGSFEVLSGVYTRALSFKV